MPSSVQPCHRRQRSPRRCTTKNHLPKKMFLVLAYNAFPCAVLPPQATKPVMLSCLRAALHASIHFFSGLFAKAFLALAEAALLTILPVLLFTNWSLVMPVLVFAFPPANTTDRANLPFATLLTFMAFLAFIAAFITAAFIAGFIAAFIAFIAGFVA